MVCLLRDSLASISISHHSYYIRTLSLIVHERVAISLRPTVGLAPSPTGPNLHVSQHVLVLASIFTNITRHSTQGRRKSSYWIAHRPVYSTECHSMLKSRKWITIRDVLSNLNHAWRCGVGWKTGSLAAALKGHLSMRLRAWSFAELKRPFQQYSDWLQLSKSMRYQCLWPG